MRAPDIKTVFKQKFGYTPTHVVKAPGRIELLGNHTDYNQGLVLSAAIDKYTWMAASPRSDGRIELASSAFPEKEKFWISESKKNPDSPWTGYVKGVLEQLRKHRVYFGGFNAAIHSSIPMGAGLSSSGALTVASALLLRQLYPHRLTLTGSASPPKRSARGRLPTLSHPERINTARLCQAAENQFVGVQCGLLDQLTSLCGQEFHALEIDFMHHTVEAVPIIGEFAIILCNSGVKHELVDGKYNELRALCESGAKKLGVKSLRAVELPMLKRRRADLTEREYQCVYHILGENQRVIFAERALRDGDLTQFGHFLYLSHESSRDYFQNSCPELDLLVKLARDHPACVGARLTGGGFGGATLNLVKMDRVDLFMEYMSTAYERATGRKTTPMRCRIVDGAE